MFVLVEVGHGYPSLGLLHHVGLVPQIDVDDGRRQLAGLSIHLHRDGLVGGERHLFTLMEPFAVATHLQRGLDTRQQYRHISEKECTSAEIIEVRGHLVTQQLVITYQSNNYVCELSD